MVKRDRQRGAKMNKKECVLLLLNCDVERHYGVANKAEGNR